VIEQASRTCDHDFHSSAEGRKLRSLTHAAVDRDAANFRIAAQLNDFLVDLLGQFAGRGHDQGPNFATRPLAQALENRQHEGSRLSRSGLGQS
jgi:hypothetical protein